MSTSIAVFLIVFAWATFVIISSVNKERAMHLLTEHYLAKLAVAEHGYQFLGLQKEYFARMEPFLLEDKYDHYIKVFTDRSFAILN